MWHEERLLIDGDLVPAGGNKTYETVNPTTGEVLGVAADATADDADRAVGAARKAFDTTRWATDRDLRARCLAQFCDALRANRDALRDILVAEVGAPMTLIEGAQLDSPLDIAAWYVDLLGRYELTEDLGPTEFRGEMHNRWVEKEPAGVVAAIVPYNFPVQISLAKVMPALAAGCTVALKAAPQCPWSTAALGRIAAEATDMPPGVFNVLTSSAVEPGATMVADRRVDMVSMTGSTAAGRQIMADAAPQVKKLFLELGGKSAFVVLDDANLELAAMLASFTICAHAGQGCAITSRLLVPESRMDEIVPLVQNMLGAVPYGDPADGANLMGPLISEEQRRKVDGYVERAVADGATLVTGGRAPEHLPDGYFYEPTLLTGVDPDSAIAQEEVFGPVLALIPFRDDDHAVEIANNSIFGLSGSVYSEDPQRATAVGRRIRAGTLSINGGMFYGPDAPFGGYKQSGIGREMGVPGLEEYLELKTFARPAG